MTGEKKAAILALVATAVRATRSHGRHFAADYNTEAECRATARATDLAVEALERAIKEA